MLSLLAKPQCLIAKTTLGAAQKNRTQICFLKYLSLTRMEKLDNIQKNSFEIIFLFG
jgi:hypothetical protein